MNTTTRTENTALATAKAPQFDLSPQTFEQALTFANYLADSEMVPKNFRGKPGDCLIAMQWGSEVGLKTLQALQSIAVINGRPGLFGDAGKALLISHGCIIDEDDTAIVRQNGRARCKIIRPGRPPVERTFSMEDAKTAQLLNKDGPWKQYPQRQMMWRAFWFAARDAAADILRGMGGSEELADMTTRDMGPADVVQHVGPVASDELRKAASDAAAKGVAAYQTFWKDAGTDNRKALASDHEANKAAAIAADQKRTVDNSPAPAEEPSKAQVAGQQANTGAPVVTYAVVMDKLVKAKNLDALDVSADWIGEVPDPGQRAELSAKYEELKKGMQS